MMVKSFSMLNDARESFTQIFTALPSSAYYLSFVAYNHRADNQGISVLFCTLYNACNKNLLFAKIGLGGDIGVWHFENFPSIQEGGEL